METRAHHILIGLFTMLVVGAALLFALWLNKNHSDTRFQSYDIVFQLSRPRRAAPWSSTASRSATSSLQL